MLYKCSNNNKNIIISITIYIIIFIINSKNIEFDINK